MFFYACSDEQSGILPFGDVLGCYDTVGANYSVLRFSVKTAAFKRDRIRQRDQLKPNSITLSCQRTSSRAGSRAGLRPHSELVADMLAS